MKTKKFFVLLAAMLLSCASAFAQSGNNIPVRGDVNNDGIVDLDDIVCIIDIMKKGGGTATLSYFYLGTTEPTAQNYKTLLNTVTTHESFDDAVGTTAAIAAGQTLYMLCPAAWMEEETPVLEDKDGNDICFLEEKDFLTISDYVIYKTNVWNESNNVVLRSNSFPKLRVCFYETIPGYSARNLRFFSNSNTFDGGDQVYLYSKSKSLSLGKLKNYAGKEMNEPDGLYIGRSSNNTTMTDFVAIDQGKSIEDFELKINFNLIAIDASGETIELCGATAKIPAEYLQWKANSKYTYIFKISDNTKGYIGDAYTGPADLYPITLDAIVTETTDGETIATVQADGRAKVGKVREATFTLDGRRTTTWPTQQGIYIRGGKKTAVR